MNSTLWQKENYKFLRILKADTRKQIELKEKKKDKRTLEKRDNFSGHIYVEEITSEN